MDRAILQNQSLSQIQTQKMSQSLFQTLKLLSLNNFELSEEIYKEVQENPALEIVRDSSVYSKSRSLSSGSAEDFEKFLENQEDEKETLKEHLLHQLGMCRISNEKQLFCEKLINNLDDKGYHFLSPVTLLDKNNSFHTTHFLEECIKIVQDFEPSGICVKNLSESLILQAKQKQNKNPLVYFILNDRLDLISPPDSQLLLQKLKKIRKEQDKLAQFMLLNENKISENLTEQDCKNAILFIKTLNPFPASDFKKDENVFIQPDAVFEDGNLTFTKDLLPKVILSPDVESFSNSEIKKYVAKAKTFLQSLDFLENNVKSFFTLLVSKQADFLQNGPGNLVSLSQKDFSKILNISESTISRFCSNKFLRCKWGVFPAKYFFSSSPFEKDKIKALMKKLIAESENEGKKITDEELSKKLLEQGFKISRRTVNKYRNE